VFGLGIQLHVGAPGARYYLLPAVPGRWDLGLPGANLGGLFTIVRHPLPLLGVHGALWPSSLSHVNVGFLVPCIWFHVVAGAAPIFNCPLPAILSDRLFPFPTLITPARGRC
jgi:hypothetical protein